ncbi:protein MTSS 1 isoform X2 [Denticeps clupeoides]|uniref:protein MTSS 1 isoform X2 n=1 Tax=Denticeps clupeoides TaxID=299321 RepID=UPI0010A36B39|nr:protein MTSS 2-like isoform X2 [Denticeps clupeoides]
MDAGIEKECSALGGLFQTIMNDMKASYPAWEDFVTKGTKLQSQLRTTILVTSSFLDAFQKVADLATGTRGATKEIGSALTRMCMRHRSIETKLKLFTTALMDNLISPLELKIEEWKKVAGQLDKDHAKEYKRARADIKKKSSDTVKLQKKVKKGKDDVRLQLDSALQDVNTRYAVLEETEKRAVCRALIEERSRFCSFVSMLKPVLDEEISMLGEVTHLQTILEDLSSLTAEPNKLPPASEQVILDLKGSDYSYAYQTPPASPSNTMSRKGSISSNYQTTSVRHVPSLDSISSAMDGIHLQPPDTSQRSLSPVLRCEGWAGPRSLSEGNSPTSARSGPRSLPTHLDSAAVPDHGGLSSQPPWGGQTGPGTENGTSMPPPHNAYTQHGERGRTLSTSSGKPQTAREQLALTLSGGGGLNSDAPRTSRDSLHCSSGYSTQTTTPSCSEDTIPSHDYDYISLHGGEDVSNQPDFDKSSTIPRNSDLSLQCRKLFQNKRPASTVSLLADSEPLQRPSNVATIRRKPSSKPTIRRGTISGGVPIPISTPQVPLKPSVSTVGLGTVAGSDESMYPPPPSIPAPVLPPGVGQSELAFAKQSLCQSTQSLSTMASPYYSMFPGKQALGSTETLYQMTKQQQYALHQQQQRQFQQQCLNPQQTPPPPQYNNQQQTQYNQQQHQQQTQYNHQQHQQQTQYNHQQHQQQTQYIHQQHQQQTQYIHQQHQQQTQYNHQQHQQQTQYNNQQQQQTQYNNQQQQQTQYNNQQQQQQTQYNQQPQQQIQYNKQQQTQYNQQHQQSNYNQLQQMQYNQHQQKQIEYTQKQQTKYNRQFQQTQYVQQPPPYSQQQQPHPQKAEHVIDGGHCPPAQEVEASSPDTSESSGAGDMLSMIRRGVKLRRTLTNDRSAPFITSNHLS